MNEFLLTNNSKQSKSVIQNIRKTTDRLPY